jgi:hypothetical protein
MGVSVTNLIQGPARLFWGDFGDAGLIEPTDAEVNVEPPEADGWTDVGGTTEGLNGVIEREFAMLTMDQIIDRGGSRATSRGFTFSTNMAEPTLDNLVLALDGGTLTPGVGPPVTESFEPNSADSSTQPAYKSLIVWGWAPNSKRRMVIVRKVLNIGNVAFAYSKENQTVFAVSWAAHYVSPSIKPWKIIDDVTP